MQQRGPGNRDVSPTRRAMSAERLVLFLPFQFEKASVRKDA
jgi:hypothetical protein